MLCSVFSCQILPDIFWFKRVCLALLLIMMMMTSSAGVISLYVKEPQSKPSCVSGGPCGAVCFKTSDDLGVYIWYEMGACFGYAVAKIAAPAHSGPLLCLNSVVCDLYQTHIIYTALHLFCYFWRLAVLCLHAVYDI